MLKAQFNRNSRRLPRRSRVRVLACTGLTGLGDCSTDRVCIGGIPHSAGNFPRFASRGILNRLNATQSFRSSSSMQPRTNPKHPTSMATAQPNPSITPREIMSAWGKILGGKAPMLSIEITRECPLSCPGCYAYGDTERFSRRCARQWRPLFGQEKSADARVPGGRRADGPPS
jgi:hypothetical protein